MISRFTQYLTALGLTVMSLHLLVLNSAAEPGSKSGNMGTKVQHIEKRLHHVEKRTDQNFRYIDAYDDSFAKIFRTLDGVKSTLNNHSSTLKSHTKSLTELKKRPAAGQVSVPKVARVHRPSRGAADMAGVDPADVEALWRQVDAILAVLEEMRKGQ